jgi:YegS/Rv2252/BmrU family lipid kinase
VGGDGTVNEVVRGLAGGDTTLVVIPSGSGNDFVRSLGIPKDYKEAIELIEKGRVSRIDLGLINGNYFINMAGIGFDAQVAYKVNRKKFLKGSLAYVAAVVRTLGEFKPLSVRITVDGKIFNENITLIAIANGRYVGGGIKMAPLAILDDGLLDICIVKDVSKYEIIKTFPLLYKGGHINHPKCIFLKGKNIKIEFEGMVKQVFIQADGQEICEMPLEFSIMPKAIPVILP